jgi:hypothetical protein
MIALSGMDPEGRFGGADTLLSATKQTCEQIAKKFARNIPLDAIYLISDLKIIQQAIKLRRASHKNSISFCTKIVPSRLA